jgi:hypothetical protein
MSAADAHGYLLRLLFDADLRDELFADRERVLAESGLGPADAALFRKIDREGLELDASLRRTYLMSALCRAYPLTAACLGAQPGGARALGAFLTSPALFEELGKRTEAFGEHLGRLLEFNVFGLPPALVGFVTSFLAFEFRLATVAAAARQAVGRGEKVTVPKKPERAKLHRRTAKLPPYFLATELPVPRGVLQGALDHVTAEDAWARIESGRLSAGRLLTVARADATPTTVVARTWASNTGSASDLSPLIDVGHVVAELPGRRSGLLRDVDGTTPLGQLREPLRGLATRLAEEGLLDLD